MAIKTYQASEVVAHDLAQAVSTWLEAQAYETQVIEIPSGATVQARSMASWVERNAVALQVRVLQQSGQLSVEVGTTMWTMQAVSGVAAAIVFWPLLALPAFAAYKQKQIIDETWRWIDQYVAAGGRVGSADDLFAPVATRSVGTRSVATHGVADPVRLTRSLEPVDTQAQVCPSCFQPVAANIKYCSNCGAKLATACPACGEPLEAGAQYCEHCGAEITAKV